jgi:hypothetical protein
MVEGLVRASDATHSRVAVAGWRAPRGLGCRDYASAGWVDALVAVQSCAGRSPVGIWVAVTRPAEPRAWRAWSIWPRGLVVVEGLADLAAGQRAGVLPEDGVDRFGEWLASRAGQCPRRGPGGVVLEREAGPAVARGAFPEDRSADSFELLDRGRCFTHDRSFPHKGRRVPAHQAGTRLAGIHLL